MLPAASSSFARRVLRVAARARWPASRAILQPGDLLVHRVLALRQRLRLRLARRALLPVEAGHFVGDVLLLVREILRVLQRLLDVAIAAARSDCSAVSAAPGVACRARLAPARRRPSIRSRPPAASRSRLPADSAPLPAGSDALARASAAEPPRRLLEFLRDLTLQIAAAAARLALTRRRESTLPLGFLLLPARQLLQFFGELVDLLVAALLLGALLQLVLVGELVHLELEQVGEIFGHLILAAATAAAAPRCVET